jgi:hypothetical protein
MWPNPGYQRNMRRPASAIPRRSESPAPVGRNQTPPRGVQPRTSAGSNALDEIGADAHHRGRGRGPGDIGRLHHAACGGLSNESVWIGDSVGDTQSIGHRARHGRGWDSGPFPVGQRPGWRHTTAKPPTVGAPLGVTSADRSGHHHEGRRGLDRRTRRRPASPRQARRRPRLDRSDQRPADPEPRPWCHPRHRGAGSLRGPAIRSGNDQRSRRPTVSQQHAALHGPVPAHIGERRRQVIRSTESRAAVPEITSSLCLPVTR